MKSINVISLLVLSQIAFAEVVESQELKDIDGSELNDALINTGESAVIWHKNIGNELVEINGKIYSLGVPKGTRFVEITVGWDEIKRIFGLYPGYIYFASQSHSLKVCIGLRNGTLIRSTESKIDDIAKLISDSPNKGINYATE
jgi:hypothetical protein